MGVKEVLKQLDDLYQICRRDEAELLLEREISSCRRQKDEEGLLLLFNELMGLYRETGRAEKGILIAEEAALLIQKLNLCQTPQQGATLLNAASVHRVAGHYSQSLMLYQQAAEIFQKNNLENSFYMASLYNNKSQVYLDMNQYEAALNYQEKALYLIETFSNNQSEIATTKINISYTYMALNKLEEAGRVLEEAMEYYQTSGKNDSHYPAFLSAFGHLAFNQKDYVLAAQYFQQALETELNTFGENDACKMIRLNLQAAMEKIKQ